MQDKKLPRIILQRDLIKHLKRGHRWIFADCFSKEKTVSGLHELYFKNEKIGLGIVQADTQLRFRLLMLTEDAKNLREWILGQWKKAVEIRSSLPNSMTNSFRLINGEGDGMPGLIIDIYDQVAVIKHDHEAMEEFWDHNQLTDLLLESFPFIQCVYLKRKNSAEDKGIEIYGKLPEEVIFAENGVLFASHIRDAAKTGFFLDQRDNRKLISAFSKNKNVLNLFSYTGGFSLFAASGGAKHVTSVDIAKPAIKAVQRNFEINPFKVPHDDIAEDAFAYISRTNSEKRKFDLVINDPPSFAPNEKALEKAIPAYTQVYRDSLKLVQSNGYFAASSCSSHLKQEAFMDLLKESFSKARKKGTLVYLGGQPFDHPYPMIMEELRYLKFALFRVD